MKLLDHVRLQDDWPCEDYFPFQSCEKIRYNIFSFPCHADVCICVCVYVCVKLLNHSLIYGEGYLLDLISDNHAEASYTMQWYFFWGGGVMKVWLSTGWGPVTCFTPERGGDYPPPLFPESGGNSKEVDHSMNKYKHDNVQ